MSEDDKQWRPLPISQWPNPKKVSPPKPKKVSSPEPEEKTLLMNDGIPCGYQLVQAEVWTNGKDIVVTGLPDDIWPGYEDCDDDHPHNCDAMACGLQHVIARATLATHICTDEQEHVAMPRYKCTMSMCDWTAEVLPADLGNDCPECGEPKTITDYGPPEERRP